MSKRKRSTYVISWLDRNEEFTHGTVGREKLLSANIYNLIYSPFKVYGDSEHEISHCTVTNTSLAY